MMQRKGPHLQPLVVNMIVLLFYSSQLWLLNRVDHDWRWRPQAADERSLAGHFAPQYEYY